jgi:UDP-N-acetyl-D-mannosaminuronic acid dehydrogenase
MEIKKICVMGLGYIGLPTASLLANNGFNVAGVDKQAKLVTIVNGGGVHIEEPGLKALVNAAVNSGLLKASELAEKADVFFIAVPTPVKEDSGRKVVDLSFVEAAAEEIGGYLQQGNLVILESTSPPKTTCEVVAPLLEKRSGLKAGSDFYLAHCPERVLPGNTLKELIQNNRVIGGINQKSAEKAHDLYKRFVEGKISLTDATTAEMVKLIENTYRDVNIALANEIAAICEKSGIDAWETIELANLHPRVQVHQPGPGVGGHCISVDPWFIISTFENEAKLIAMARKVNDRQPGRVVKKLIVILQGLERPKVTILGVTYKGNIDDTRESPALKIIEGLKEAGIDYAIYDPHVSSFPCEISGLEEAFTGSDCAVILADHEEFRYLLPGELGSLMRNQVVFDTRNCLDRNHWEESGFRYYLLGVGEI